MKTKFFTFLILISLFAAAPAFAEETKTYYWDHKLIRGVLNIISSPVEIGRSIHLQTEESSLLEGWTVGLAKGFGNGLVRLGAGAVDVLTCPFNFPDENKGPLIQPEYVWEKPGLKYTS